MCVLSYEQLSSAVRRAYDLAGFGPSAPPLTDSNKFWLKCMWSRCERFRFAVSVDCMTRGHICEQTQCGSVSWLAKIIGSNYSILAAIHIHAITGLHSFVRQCSFLTSSFEAPLVV